MGSINDRIALVIKDTGLSRNAFSKRIDYSATGIFNVIEGRRSEPNFKLLKSISEEFNIDGNWLLHGEGSMYRNQGMSLETERLLKENSELKDKLIDCQETVLKVMNNM